MANRAALITAPNRFLLLVVVVTALTGACEVADKPSQPDIDDRSAIDSPDEPTHLASPLGGSEYKPTTTAPLPSSRLGTSNPFGMMGGLGADLKSCWAALDEFSEVPSRPEGPMLCVWKSGPRKLICTTAPDNLHVDDEIFSDPFGAFDPMPLGLPGTRTPNPLWDVPDPGLRVLFPDDGDYSTGHLGDDG